MPFRPKDLQECTDRYGKLQKLPDGRYCWPNAETWVKACYIPKDIGKHLLSAQSRTPVERIFCNTDIHDPLLEAFENVLTSDLQSELKTFDGCYNVRMVRGSDSVFSLHSYAIAIDLNARDNPLGGRSSWSDAFVRCWTDAGWRWGGNFKSRRDPMHFDWVDSPQSPKLNS